MSSRNSSLSLFSGRARLAVVLGSGLSAMERLVQVEEIVSYAQIPGLAEPSVSGHPGRLSLCRIGGSRLLLFAGRLHVYEGLTGRYAGSTVSLAAQLGCSSVILTQAAGSLHAALPERVWMLASGVVSLPCRASRFHAAGAAPTGGIRPGALCGRTVSVSSRLGDAVKRSALQAGVELREGTLYWTPGPHYETPAEARAALALGADAVGMSSVPELAAAAECGIEPACLCWITNHTPNVTASVLVHGDVTSKGGEGAEKLVAIIEKLIYSRDR